ncbi:MAG TPA: hypothetical protein VK524_03475 [Polyangiaceae bacterium]|nr:hypothetical protein [Polyangiaceae bacterium]
MNTALPWQSSHAESALGPWLWSPAKDLAVFGGSALFALGVLVAGQVLGIAEAELPEWGFIAFILCIDVAHVYSTLFRTYFDRAELRQHPLRYWVIPFAVYAAGVLLYLHGASTFWRVLAYVAVFHFVRQQVGWVAVYRARAGNAGRVDVWTDNAATYAAALYPIVEWHARLDDRRFAWFMSGDFMDVAFWAERAAPYARTLWILALCAFALRQVQLAFSERRIQIGKICVVSSTAALWYVGIVATNSDFAFSVTNVIAHGVPYLALLWAYTRERRREAPESLGSQLAAGGVGAFAGVVLVLAFVEELLWDRLVWKERSWFFGSSEVELGALALALLVPLLALPQAVHYVLDGFLWRRGDTRRRRAQRRALGFSD